MRRASALLGVLALLQLCLVSFLHSAEAASGPAWLKGAICRGAGGASPTDGGSVPAPQKPRFCPICLAVSAGGIGTLPVVAGLTLPRAVLSSLRSTPAPPRPATWHGRAALPRAPPVMA